MNPNEWNAHSDHDYLYNEVMRRSSERFFTCECRFGTFKLRSALENVFLLEAHNCAQVHTLTYEKIRVPYGNRNYIPDFFVNGEHIIECKALRDQLKPEVIVKAKAAEAFVEEQDWLYHLMDYKDFKKFFSLL